jgi:hypothetical protein
MRTCVTIFLDCIVLFLASGCDRYWDTQKEFINNTEDTICIRFSGETAAYNLTDSLFLLPGSRKVISPGRSMSNSCDPFIYSQEVTVETSSGRTLLKDISDAGNWSCEQNKSTVNLKFVFNETDFH